MLRIDTNSSGRLCDGLDRRDFLRIGAYGLSGLSLSALSQQADANPGGSYVRDKSVILLFLGGGPSQYETFDPKPDGPGTSTSIAGHIATRLPGIRFASYFPRLAELADRLTIVRSFQTNHAEHNGAHKQLMTGDLSVQDGKPITEPGLGAMYARAAGAIHPRTGMPRHAVVPPTTRSTEKGVGFTGAYESIVEGAQPAWLGSSFAPFETHVEMPDATAKKMESGGQKNRKNHPLENPFLDDLEPRVPALRIDARLDLLRQFDGLNRRLDALGDLQYSNEYTRQAVELLRGGALRQALDLAREHPGTLAAYDTQQYRNFRCDAESKFERNGPSIGISLGRQLLLARRLCEAGCGFVSVIHSNWDFHARKNIPNIPEGMSVLAPPLDHAVAAFLRDIHERGLSDKILLVVTGEFGRTPSLDKNLGRHHWPKICPLVFAGGGLRHGQIIGESDRRGGEPASEPITIADLHATVLHTLFDVGQMRLDSSLPGKLLDRAQRGKPIEPLFS
jgi:uncharacterized protein (DUF1501 family)